MRFYHDFLFVCRPFDSDSKVIGIKASDWCLRRMVALLFDVSLLGVKRTVVFRKSLFFHWRSAVNCEWAEAVDK